LFVGYLVEEMSSVVFSLLATFSGVNNNVGSAQTSLAVSVIFVLRALLFTVVVLGTNQDKSCAAGVQ